MRYSPLCLTLLAATALVVLAACSSTTSGAGTASRPAGPTSALPTSATESPAAPTATVTVTSTPTPSVTTATVTAPPDTETSPASGALRFPEAFVGQWDGHGRSMLIRSDGDLEVVFRIYRWCRDQADRACDRQRGNVIHDGGQVSGHLVSVRNTTTVVVDITSSTDTDAIPLGRVRLGMDLGHDAVALFAGGFRGVPFCGAQSPNGYCGA